MIAVVLLTFAAVFLSILALFFAVTADRRSTEAQLKRRLRRMEKTDGELTPERATVELLRETPASEQFIFRLPLLRTIKKLVEQSGVMIKPSRFVLLAGIPSISGFVALYAVKGNLPAALLAAAVIAFIPVGCLAYRKRQREIRFAEQLPDALIMVARSLRAGHSLTAAVELVGEELPEPAGGLFKFAYNQQQLGMRITDSLGTLLDKIDSVDLHFFVTIIRINSESGGNLSEILDKLAETIRSRLQIRRQVKVYTAEGRLSGYVLVLLPVFVFLVFKLKNPEYMEVFFTERACQMSLVAAGLAQVAGFLMIRKIINIRI